MSAVAYPGPPLSRGDDQIRLLTVLAGLPDDPIDCILDNYALNDIKTAEAVSYAWGSTVFSKVVSINGAPFRVGENLFQALVHLRLRTARRQLWIDALCIDQSDTAERNHQVRMMAAIYSGANRVLVWLGLETPSSNEAFDFLRTAYQRSPYNREEIKHDQGWLGLEELCSREYWTRVWIVQEICLASRLILCCGTSQIPWVYLSELRRCRKNVWPRYMSRGEQAFMRSLPARIDQQKSSRDSKGDCSLWTLLEAFQTSQCKEIHDKVYGFMGLSTDCGSTGIPIDYSKSVQQLYSDVILFYYQKFRSKSSTPCSAAQLISLSEFLQTLLACRSGVTVPSDLQHAVSGCDALLAPDPDSNDVVEISAFSTLVVDKFLSLSDASSYNATKLVQFLNGEIPYSHLGFWRDFIDDQVSGVSASGPSQASLIYHSANNSTFEQGSVLEQAISRPSVFIARTVSHYLDTGNETDDSKTEFVIGIAPPGCQRGDLVCTFVDTRMVLIARPSPIDIEGVSRTSSDCRAPKLHGKVFRPIVGRAVIDFSRSTWAPAFKSISNSDKSIQITQARSHVDGLETPWSATLVIDLPSLQRLTNSMPDYSPMKEFDAATFDVLPIRRQTDLRTRQQTLDDSLRSLTTHAGPTHDYDPTVLKGKSVANDDEGNLQERTATVMEPVRSTASLDDYTNDEEMERLRENAELRRHALGPGYGGIINLGSTGYLSCVLQLYYMMKPFRDTVLQMRDTEGSLFLAELQKLFRHLQHSSLPASPLGLTKSFGWSEMDLHEPQDVGMFIDESQKVMHDMGGPVYDSFEAIFFGECLLKKRRLETFFYTAFHATLGTLQAGIADTSADMEYQRLPVVWMMRPTFKVYDFDKDALETWRGKFEYPSAFQLSDFATVSSIVPPFTTRYQLIGVIVLEEVQPVARWLLYLRPRRFQDRWLLFFNDAVTFAREREVFEDNFGSDGLASESTPLRIPYILVYAQVDKLEGILG